MVRRNTSKLGHGSTLLCVLGLQQPRTHFATQPSLVSKTFRHQHQRTSGQGFHHFRVKDIQRHFINETHVHPLRFERFHGIQGAIEGVAKRHNVSGRTFPDDFVLARNKLIIFPVQGLGGTPFLQNDGGFGARSKDKAQALIGKAVSLQRKGAFHHLLRLKGIGREKEARLVSIVQSIVGKEMIQSKMARIVTHIVHSGMRKMRKDVAVVQSRHGNFTTEHFEKGGKGGKDALFLGVHTETGRGGKVASFHDTGMTKDFWGSLFNTRHVGGTAQITVDYENTIFSFRFGHGGNEVEDRLSDDFAHGIPFPRGAGVGMRIFGFGSELEIVRRMGMPLGLQIGNTVFGGESVVSVAGIFDAVNARSHFAPTDDGGGSVRDDAGLESSKELYKLSFWLKDRHILHAVSLQGFFNIVSWQIITGMARNGNVVVINDQFDIQIFGNSQSSSFRIVA